MIRSLFYLLICLSLPVFGQSNNPEDLEPAVEVHYFQEFIKMIGSLLLVLVLIVVTIWAIRKIMHSKNRYGSSGRFIQVIEKKQLHPKACVYLIEVLGKGIVVGESSGCLETLAEFSENTHLMDRIEKNEVSDHEDSSPSWKKWLAGKKKKS